MSESSKSGNSRRRFLQSAAFAGAGLTAGWPEITAGAAGASPPRAPKLSSHDTHAANGRREISGHGPDRIEVVAAVERSLASMLVDGVDRNFPVPFEQYRLKQDVGLQREVVQIATDYIMQPERRADAKASLHVMMVPKPSMFGYRFLAQTDVLGALPYLATASLIGKRLEPARIPVGERRVFSYRFVDDGPQLLDVDCDYAAFIAHTLVRLDRQQKTFLVSSDIANFYPSIDDARFLQKLRRQGVEPWLAETLGDILLQWKPQWRQGFPVGPVASHLLAEAALIDVDAGLVRDGIDFVRYVDDYRFFAEDMASARFAISRLAEHLRAENLVLNQAKTSVEAVTYSQYLSILNDRRMIKFWNQAPTNGSDRIAQSQPAPIVPKKATPVPKKGSADQKGNTKGKNELPCDTYHGCSPFKKSQLDELDLAFLDRVDPVALFSKLETQTAEGKVIRLGDFRALLESACNTGNYETIGDALALLETNPLCAIYLADVLAEERERVPASVRRMAADWFAARLVSQRGLSDHEVMNIALLLGVEGYRRPNAIYAYLESDVCTGSSIALRALLAAVHADCDVERAKALLQICPRADEFVRRAIFDGSWPHLGPDEREALVSKYRADFEADPFLRRLSRGAEMMAV